MGRLKRLRHTQDARTLARFEYAVDQRGNRIQALEALAHPTTSTDTVIAYDDQGLVLNGLWTEVSGFQESTEFGASLKLIFLGDEVTLTMGTGPDHGIYDVYVGGSLWQSFDGYAASAGQRDILITLDEDSRKLQSEGPHILEIRNRAEKNTESTDYKVRFKQLLIEDRTYDLHTIDYTYDDLSRLLEADYDSGSTVYTYGYDLAGNLVDMDGVTRTFNAANQMTNDGTNTLTYDGNGNLTNDGTNAYTWDRANRLLSMGGASHLYDGEGQRIQQTVSTTVTQYLLDVQPGLAVVLAATTGANTERYIHAPRGIHTHQDSNSDWFYPMQDGLGSVRSVADDVLAVQGIQHYAPYGEPFGIQGSMEIPFGFTGEQTDANELLYLRARYFNPGQGIFASLDKLEAVNRYSYVSGNPANRIDPNGLAELCFVHGVWTLCPSGSGGISLPPGVLFPQQGDSDLENILEQLRSLQGQNNAQPSTQGQAQEKIDCNKRENQAREECQQYWDEQEPPKNCPCPTNRHPLSARPFASELDLLCNLACYNGAFETGLHATARVGLLTDFELINSNPGVIYPAAGGFLPNGEIVWAAQQFDVSAILNRKYRGEIVTPLGGVAYVRNANWGTIFNRAVVMSGLVEEIHHEAHYHGLIPGIPRCENITVFQTEAYAKLAAFLWAAVNVAIGDIPIGAFKNDPVFTNLVGGIEGHVKDFNTLAYRTPTGGRCPGDTYGSIFASSVSCVDPLVQRHLI